MKRFKQIADLPRTIDLFFDGACEPINPGGTAAYGWAMYRSDQEVAYGYGVAAHSSTNNVAEYAGLKSALTWLVKKGWKGNLRIFGDSDLVVKQVSRKWKFRKEHLHVLCKECWEALKVTSPNYSITWIPRWLNTRCDHLSKKAYRIVDQESLNA